MNLNFEDAVKNRVELGIPPGVLFAKIDQGETAYFAYGSNSLDAKHQPNPDTRFEIGSNTKLFTALLYARMEELGILSLNDPANTHLPTTSQLPERDGVQITLEHLLTHTSALPPMPANFDNENAINSFARYNSADLLASLENISLNRAVGKSYVYSNYGYALLGYLAEEITGKRWDVSVGKYISEPLGLDSTSTEINDSDASVATPHLGKKAVPHFSTEILGAGGALKSTAKDMVKFLSLNLGLFDHELNPAMVRSRAVFYRESPIFALGLGWHLQQRNQQEIWWHRGETTGQTSFIGLDASAKTGIVMLSNSAFSGCCSDLAMAQIDPDTPLVEQMPHEILETSKSQLQQYTGEYRVDSAVSFVVSAEEDHLTVDVTAQNSGKMFPVGEHQFETLDRRVCAIFSGDILNIRQHGIDRIAFRTS